MIQNKWIALLAVSLILIGGAIFAYPNVSNYLAEKEQAEAIRTYDSVVQNFSEEERKEELQKAQIYNENLAGDPVHDPFVAGSGYALPSNYTQVLKLEEEGVMASIEIPKIKVNLPIFHGTSEETLAKGVGHIQATSLPIGGNSTHCVLTGHTGFPSAELFTKLDQMQENDIFYIHVLNQQLAYKVYEIKVILPDEIEELRITDGKDLVTLVTCTPYGINTHRLLVKASRTEYIPYEEPKEELEIVKPIQKNQNYGIGMIIGISILGTLWIIQKIHRKKINKKK